MPSFISAISLVVSDYDEAIEFYVGALGFTLKADTPQPDGKRWVTIMPPGACECALVLAKADDSEQLCRVGNQTGGRVFLFLSTDNFDRDYKTMTQNNVKFLEQPRVEPYGKVVVFADPFGNKWDLIEPA